MASFHDRDNWLVGGISEMRGCCLGDAGGFLAVTNAVDRRNQNSISAAADQKCRSPDSSCPGRANLATPYSTIGSFIVSISSPPQLFPGQVGR